MTLNLMIVAASQRPNSATLRCAKFLEHIALDSGFATSDILDLGQTPLPLWDTEVSSNKGQWQQLPNIRERAQAADALILLTPEWHGMATPAAKNFLLLCTQEELGHKPGLIGSVSAADNGVYPISEIRMTGTKNNHLCLIPEQLIFRQVDSLIEDDSLCSDETFEARSRYTLELLAEYANALRSVWRKDQFPSRAYRFGM